MRKTLAEHMFSASAPTTDMRWLHRYDRFVPKSDIDVTTIRLSCGDRKLKQSTLGVYPARPQPSSVVLDDRLADR